MKYVRSQLMQKKKLFLYFISLMETINNISFFFFFFLGGGLGGELIRNRNLQPIFLCRKEK